MTETFFYIGVVKRPFSQKMQNMTGKLYVYTPAGGYTVLPLSVLPSVQDIFRHIFLSNC